LAFTFESNVVTNPINVSKSPFDSVTYPLSPNKISSNVFPLRSLDLLSSSIKFLGSYNVAVSHPKSIKEYLEMISYQILKRS